MGMNATCQAPLPISSPEIDSQVNPLSIEKLPYIYISEKEHLELRQAAGYWRAQHKIAVLR